MSVLCSSDEEQRSSSGGSGDLPAGLAGSAAKLKREWNRQIHNEVERRRKDKLSMWILQIEELLPAGDTIRKSKTSILERAVEYITYLKNANEKLLAGRVEDVHEEELRRLRQQVCHLEAQSRILKHQLHTAGIHPLTPLESHTWSQPKKFGLGASPEQASALLRNHQAKKNVATLNRQGGQCPSPQYGTACKTVTSHPESTASIATSSSVTNVSNCEHIVSSGGNATETFNCVTTVKSMQWVNSNQTLVTQALPAEPLMSTTTQNLCLTVQKEVDTSQNVPTLTAPTPYAGDALSSQNVIVLRSEQGLNMVAIQNKSLLMPNNVPVGPPKSTPSSTSMVLQNTSKVLVGNGLLTIRPPQDQRVISELTGTTLCQQANGDGLQTNGLMGSQTLQPGTLQPAVMPLRMGQPTVAFGQQGQMTFNQQSQVAFNQQGHLAFNQQGQVITLGPGTLLTGQQSFTGSLPSALLLPNGQIIPVVTQPSVMYTNSTPLNNMSNGLVLTAPRIATTGSSLTSADVNSASILQQNVSIHSKQNAEVSKSSASVSNALPVTSSTSQCQAAACKVDQPAKRDKNSRLTSSVGALCPDSQTSKQKVVSPIKPKCDSLSAKGKSQWKIRPKSTPPAVTVPPTNPSHSEETLTTQRAPTFAHQATTTANQNANLRQHDATVTQHSQIAVITSSTSQNKSQEMHPNAGDMITNHDTVKQFTSTRNDLNASQTPQQDSRIGVGKQVTPTTISTQNSTISQQNILYQLDSNASSLPAASIVASTAGGNPDNIINHNVQPSTPAVADKPAAEGSPEASATDILAKATESIFSGNSLPDFSMSHSEISRQNYSKSVLNSGTNLSLNHKSREKHNGPSNGHHHSNEKMSASSVSSSVLQRSFTGKATSDVNQNTLEAPKESVQISTDKEFEPPEKRAKVRDTPGELNHESQPAKSVTDTKESQGSNNLHSQSEQFSELPTRETNKHSSTPFLGTSLPQLILKNASEITSSTPIHHDSSSANVPTSQTSTDDSHDITSFVNGTDNSDHELPALILSSLGDDSDAPSSVNSSSSSGLQFLALSPPEQFGSEMANTKESNEGNPYSIIGNQTSFCSDNYTCHKEALDREQNSLASNPHFVEKDKQIAHNISESTSSLNYKQHSNNNSNNQNNNRSHSQQSSPQQQQQTQQNQIQHLSQGQPQQQMVHHQENQHQEQRQLPQPNQHQPRQQSQQQQQLQPRMLSHLPNASFICSSSKTAPVSNSSQSPSNTRTTSVVTSTQNDNTHGIPQSHISSQINFVSNTPLPSLLSRSYFPHENLVNSKVTPSNFLLPVPPPTAPFELSKEPTRLSTNHCQQNQRQSPFNRERNNILKSSSHVPPATSDSVSSIRHSIGQSTSVTDNLTYSHQASTHTTTSNQLNNNNHASLSNYSTEALLGHQTSSQVGNYPCLNTVQSSQSSISSCSRSSRTLLPYSAESLLQSQPYSEKRDHHHQQEAQTTNVNLFSGPHNYNQPFSKVHTSSSSQPFFSSEPPCLPSSLTPAIVSHTSSFSHSAASQQMSNSSSQSHHHHFSNSILMTPFQDPPSFASTNSPAVGSFSQPYGSFSLPPSNSGFQNRETLNCLQSNSTMMDTSQQIQVTQQTTQQNQQPGCLFPPVTQAGTGSNMQQAAGPLLQLPDHSGFPSLIPPLSDNSSSKMPSRTTLNHFQQSPSHPPPPPPPQNHFFPSPFVTSINGRNCIPNHSFLDSHKLKDVSSRSTTSNKSTPKTKSKKSRQADSYIDKGASYFSVPELSNERFFSSPRGPTPQNLLPPPSHMSLTNSQQPTNISSHSNSYSQTTLFRPQSQLNFQTFPSVSSPRSVSVNQSSSNTSITNTTTVSGTGSNHITNFNLSNIFPDMNSAASESLTLSPLKFPPNPILSGNTQAPEVSVCLTATGSRTSLYSGNRLSNSLGGLLPGSAVTFERPPMSGIHQNFASSASHPPPSFGNVIPPPALNFPVHEH